MAVMTEIRWHGRGGQGAKTAALLTGEALMSTGFHVQAFPEYGPERRGAPVQTFNRISDQPITLHCNVQNPKIVVVLDDTLLEAVDCAGGVLGGGVVIVNTKAPADRVRAKMKAPAGVRVSCLDASGIAVETIGKDIPNTPMLGALMAASGLLKIDELLRDTKKRLEKKFASKPEVIEGNLKAIEKAYQAMTKETA